MKSKHACRTLLAIALGSGLWFTTATLLAMPETEPEEQNRGQADADKSAQPASDTWITTKVKADLLATEDVSGLDIKVETVNGVVTLSGRVDSQAQIDKAVSVARAIKGVDKVDSKGLKVSKP
jgi:hyperosmotically inducible protein